MSRLIPDLTKFSTLLGGVPVGTVIYYAGINLPSEEWKWTNGESLNKQDYPELFNAIGYTYGGGGSQFNLPDTRDEFIRSTGSTNTLGSKTKDTMKKVELNLHSIDHGGFEGAWLSEGTDGEMINDLWVWDNPGGHFVSKLRTHQEKIDVSDVTPFTTHMPFEASQSLGNAKGYSMPVFDYVARVTLGTGSETKPRNIVMNVIIKVK